MSLPALLDPAEGIELSVVGATMLGMAPITSDAPFVARARELARLEHLLEQAVAGSAAGVLVAGDAGVGKTRLTAELVRRAQERGVVTVVGHCVDQRRNQATDHGG